MKKKHPSYIESEIQWIKEIPKEWQLIKAKWLFKEKSLKGYPSETLLSVSKGRGLLPRDQLESKAVMAFKDLENFKLVVPNDFVIHLRSFQSGFELSKVKGIVSPAYTVFSGKELIYPDFYKYIFYTKGFIDYIAATTQSLRDGKPIAYNTFGDMELPLPSYKEQMRIAEFLNFKTQSIDLLIKEKEKLINLLEEKRQSMITEAVTKGLNPNVKLKDSGVEWIGEIPEHWDIKKIKHISTYIGSGKTPKGGSEIYPDKGIIFLRSMNVHYSGLKLQDVVYITPEINDEMKSTQVQPKDILLNITGASIGRSCMVPLDLGRANVNQHVCIIRGDKNRIVPELLKEIMAADFIKQQILMNQNGSSREGLNFAQVKELQFPMPLNLKEQFEIAKYISDQSLQINSLIEDIQNQIRKLKDYRQSIIYEAVTGKIDVREFEVVS